MIRQSKGLAVRETPGQPAAQAHPRRRYLPSIECLEDRLLLSVSAAALTGEMLTPGAKWTDSFGESGASFTESQDVIGPAKFGGVEAIKIGLNIDGGPVEYAYETLDSSGLRLFGALGTVYSPPRVVLPPEMAPGVSYTFKGTAANNGQGASSYSDTIKLVSATMIKMKVPAGTFETYEVDDTFTTASGALVSQSWYAPGVGKVNSVSVSPSGDKSATVLTSFEAPDTAPSVTSDPNSQSVSAGATATFTAAASGNPAPAIQWQVSTNSGKTFTNIAGATSNAYSFKPTKSETGYEYRAVFTNSKGSTTTTAAKLTVIAATIPAYTLGEPL